MNSIESEFATFASTFEVLELINLIFLSLIVIETVWDISSGKRKWGESLANFFIGAGNVLLERTVFSLVFILGLFITEAFAAISIPYTWWSWIIVLILADLSYYWMHRIEHEIRFFWAYHSVHHSSPEFNLTTSLRLAWIEGMIEWLFFIPMILIGFEVVQTIIAISIVVIYQTWIHTEKIGTLGWADKVFNTPSVHRVHHGSNSKYLDKNYGGILMLWDRLFGTYQAEEEAVIYGLTHQIGTTNPIMINIYEYWNIIKDIKNANSFSEILSYLYRAPGWKPNTSDKV